MNRLLAYLSRFAAITAGFILAVLAASLFANLLLLGLAGWGDVAPLVFDGPIYFTVPFLAALFGYHAFGPAFIGILIAEYLALRDWLYHALAGGAAAGVAIFMAWERPVQRVDADIVPILAVVACGLVGGIVYWMVAGKRSGVWLHGEGEA